MKPKQDKRDGGRIQPVQSVHRRLVSIKQEGSVRGDLLPRWCVKQEFVDTVIPIESEAIGPDADRIQISPFVA